MNKKKSITITEDQFRDAIIKADEKWREIGKKADDQDPMKHMMMSMHNIMFGSLITQVLFEESEDAE